MLLTIRETFAKMREFGRNAKMSRPEFEAFKLQKFRRLVAHAAQKSPYYAQIVQERAIDIANCTPQDFPVLTKSTLMANFDRIVTDRRITKQAISDFLSRSTDPNEFLFDKFHVLHTSGSSGEVGYFVYSERDWVRGMAQNMRRRGNAARNQKRGLRRGRFAFYGAIGGHFAGVSMISGAQRGFARLLVNVQLYEVNSPLPEVIEQLNAFQPDYMFGYTTAMKILAAKQREGTLRIAPMAIGTGGEGMTQADKELLESAFGCEASSGYGCTEHLMMGGTSPAGDSMVLYDDDLIYEFFDDHSLVTNLFNFTLPLIRYRMSDILKPLPVSKYSPYIEIDSLVGRTELVPTFTNNEGAEDFISPHTINEIFVAGVARFQMQLLSATSFVFKVCLDSQLTLEQRKVAVAGVEKRLREILEQKRLGNVSFEVEATGDLPVNPRTRKFQLIVDKRSG